MIKVTLGEQPKEEKPFPKLATLGKCGGVFLAISKRDILCLKRGNSGWDEGDFNTNNFDWDDEYFQDYNGAITIQNA